MWTARTPAERLAGLRRLARVSEVKLAKLQASLRPKVEKSEEGVPCNWLLAGQATTKQQWGMSGRADLSCRPLAQCYRRGMTAVGEPDFQSTHWHRATTVASARHILLQLGGPATARSASTLPPRSCVAHTICDIPVLRGLVDDSRVFVACRRSLPGPIPPAGVGQFRKKTKLVTLSSPSGAGWRPSSISQPHQLHQAKARDLSVEIGYGLHLSTFSAA